MGEERRPTIYDVAEDAGVAASTVSRAFARPGRVSAATHAKVMASAKRLGYRTDIPAQQQRDERSHRLGIELADITNPYFAEVVSGMQEAAQAHGYMLLLLDSTEDEDREREVLQRSIDVVDGIVLAGSRLADVTLGQLSKQVPLVVLNRRVAGLDSVTPDYAHGMVQVMEHLAERGARRIVYTAGPVNSWSDAERWRTARIAAQHRDLVLHRVGPFPPTTRGGEEAYASLREDLPDAVVAYNDLLATGILVSALRDGVKVPDELSVIGHDDIPLARLIGGAGLTTVASPKRAQGRAAVERLVRHVENPSSVTGPVEGSLPVRLIPRGSTGRRRSR